MDSIADALLRGLNQDAIVSEIEAANSPGRSSGDVQKAILPVAESLGFHSERKGLFADYDVPGLRPDYYLQTPQHGTGILFEVERGKTVQNNMDLLDLWKCHICAEASVLFLLVPRVLVQSTGGREQQVFPYVEKRLSTFFTTGNATNVEALYLFGY